MKKLIFAMLGLTLLVSSCSKEEGKTQASLSLSVSGIAKQLPTLGAGGAILFGRSSTGEQFGKKINDSEENLIIPNGDWTFYAFMWEQNVPGKMMNGIVRCAKTVAKLSGTDVTLNLNLMNGTCSDPEFSNGRNFTDPTNNKVRFAEIFLDECDDINPAAPNWFCGQDNHGSALSYRMKFQSYKRGPDGAIAFGPDFLFGTCKRTNKSDPTELYSKGLDINFPSGSFLVSVEMFIGSGDCSTTEPKGVYSVLIDKGFGDKANPQSTISFSNVKCANPKLPTDPKEKQNRCDALNGNWDGTNCNDIPESTLRFHPADASQCNTANPTVVSIKHSISIPRNRLCDPFEGKSFPIGHPFAGGNGTLDRPYKICNEWQLNQIGENSSTYSHSIFKLMKDLDMNKTDMGPYARPSCVGATGSVVEKHHNLNPLDGFSNCTSPTTSSGFYGKLIGNKKTIRNARIQAEEVNGLGLVRDLNDGEIRDLTFINFEVSGKNSVGAIAGMAEGYSRLSNIKIIRLDLEAKSGGSDGSNIGGVAGEVYSNSIIEKVSIVDGEVRGRSNLGGIVGNLNGGKLNSVGFRGTVDHHESSGNYVGGLVGLMQSGAMIEKSFSEGIINSSAEYTGGILGKAVSSEILNSVYSTMAINSHYPSPNAFIGGISGNMGSMTDVFFDGKIKHTGGTTTNIAGVSLNTSTASNCYSTFNPASGGCSFISTYSNLRNGTPVFSSPGNWVKTNGSIPRLVWEQRECAILTNHDVLNDQITAGKGSLANPLIICNATQFKNMDSRPAGLFYRLADDLNLSEWTTDTNLISVFNGNLNGDGHLIYGANVQIAANPPVTSVGLINRSTGTIKNLKLSINKFDSLQEKFATGLLVGTNQGIIENIEFQSNELNGFDRVGLVAGYNESLGQNSGIINQVHIEESAVKGYRYVGGSVGLNSLGAKISRVKVRAKITNVSSPSLYTIFGGVVGANLGNMDQTQFGGEIMFTSASSASSLSAGGLAGRNEGFISNSLVDNYSRMRTQNFTDVGGLVGYNTTSASLVRSINLGRLISNISIPASQLFHATVGNNEGAKTNNFYLENNSAYFVQTGLASSCDGSYVTMQIATAPFTLGTTAFDFILKDNDFNSGNGLQSLPSATIPLTAGDVTFTGSCANNDSFSVYKKYDNDQTDLLDATELADISTYNGIYDIADETSGLNVDRLYEYYISRMENRLPTKVPPIWELDDHDGYPRLLQLEH
jgi:hypothetical protein